MTDEPEGREATEGDTYEMYLSMLLGTNDPGKIAMAFIIARLLADADTGKANREWAEMRVAQLIAVAGGFGHGES